jgi:hypothetical protein
MKKLLLKKQRGYIVLISVLIIGAVGLAITTSLIILGIGFSQTSYTIVQSAQAKGLTNACLSDALQKIRNSTSFSGVGSLTLEQGTCRYLVTVQTGENRQINASSTVGSVIRKSKITITQINPRITVSSWQEVADY